MANKEIHELITAEELSASDVIAEQRENSGTWLTRKLTFNALGLFLLKVLNFASDLHTTSKTIIGAINELAQGSGQSLDTLNDVDIDDETLADGQGIVYDATAQKWKNGIVGGGHTYSTTEQVVGAWIDGSPVYERIFTMENVSGNLLDWAVIAPIANVASIVEFNGWCKGRSNNQFTSPSDFIKFAYREGNLLYFSNVFTNTNIDICCIVRYTKSST